MTHDIRPRRLNPNDLSSLQNWLTSAIGAHCIQLAAPELLSGGAVGENWRLQLEVTGGAHAGPQDWVLRTDAYARMAMSHDRGDEFALIAAAHRAGVAVPEPITHCGDATIIGAPFMIIARIAGSAQARKIVRAPDVASRGEALARDLARQLARIHAIRPPISGLEFLPLPELPAGRHQVAALRRCLDMVSEARPALEFILTWLDRNAPPARPLVLVHGDFRTGNYMVENWRLTGILDWEFAHWGDPHEDAGYFCARCWRFGGDEIDPLRIAGGIASQAAFIETYNSVADYGLNAGEVAYWEVMGAARWAVIALLQGERFHSGGETSLELLLTGMMAPEMEFDALQAIAAIESELGERDRAKIGEMD